MLQGCVSTASNGFVQSRPLSMESSQRSAADSMLAVRAAAAYLDRVVLPGPILLGDRADSIDWDWIQQNGMHASLGIVRVHPTFYVNPWDKLRASFTLRGAHYDLAVTDLAAWTNDARQPGFRVQSDWYLTISLGERFDQKNRAYKLVAAGIEMHD